MKNLIILAAFGLMLTACATITRGTKDNVSINTTPSGAMVTASSGETCSSTPCTMRLARNESVELTIEKRGCRAQTVRLESRATAEGNTNLAGNLLLGGFIGAAVDAGNGANRDLLPNPVVVTLSC